MAGNTQMENLYNQEKFREMPTKELRECIQHDKDHSRITRAQRVLDERGDTGGGTGGTQRVDEGNVRQGGGQRGMREEGGSQGQQGSYGDERGQGDVGQRGFGSQTGGRETQRDKTTGPGFEEQKGGRGVHRDDTDELNR